MYTFIKKKIIEVSDRVSNFTRDNLISIIIIGGCFVVLELLKSFPYINIIPNYQFLVIGFVLFITAILLRKVISDKVITITIIILFALAGIAIVFDQTVISDAIGFIVFILLSFMIFRGLVSNRHAFKKEVND